MARLIIGHFGQPYGIKGWIKVHASTDPIDNILQYFPWQIQHQGQWQLITIAEARRQGKLIIARIQDCTTPELAKTYTNDTIAIEREQLPPLPLNEYYWTDLIGLRVVNQDGADFGIVDSLFETGSNDVLVIHGERQRLVPYLPAVIKHIDLTQRIMTIIWDADF